MRRFNLFVVVSALVGLLIPPPMLVVSAENEPIIQDGSVVLMEFTITVPESRLVIPKSAVRSADGVSIVFVVRDGTAERRAVTVGAADGDQVEVVSGLSAGDRVVTDGPASLADGSRVKER